MNTNGGKIEYIQEYIYTYIYIYILIYLYIYIYICKCECVRACSCMKLVYAWVSEVILNYALYP